MVKYKSVLFSLIIALTLIMALAIPAYAVDIDLPDIQELSSVEVYAHALGETDSQLWLVRFRVDYTTNTTTYDISEAFIFRLVDDGTGLTVAATTAYPYYDGGYDYGIVSFEFEADSALTWSGAYTIYLDGNPALSWEGGVIPSINTNVISWFDEGTVGEAQDRLTTRLRFIATQLEASWGLDLIEATSSGTILTELGDDYFTNSIDNLRDICPNLFYQSMQAVEYEHDILVTDIFDYGADNHVSVYGTDWYAQTITPSESYDITGVNLPFYRVGNPGTITVSIRATLAGVPTGGDLVSGTYDGNTLTTDTDAEWVAVAFTVDYSLTVGTVYSIVVRATAGNIGNQVAWLVDTGNGYANGQECTSVNSGVAWAGVAANDLLFEIEARNALTLGLASRVENRLVGTQFDFTNWSNEWGLSRIWWSTIFWLAIAMVIMVAAAFGSNSWDCSMVTLVVMVAYGWRGGWVDTILFALVLALIAGGLVYALLFKKA